MGDRFDDTRRTVTLLQFFLETLGLLFQLRVDGLPLVFDDLLQLLHFRLKSPQFANIVLKGGLTGLVTRRGLLFLKRG
jgi:hypothetical protein